MRFKLDENICEDLADDLAAIGHDAATCAQEGIAGSGDATIFMHSCQESRIVVTCDLDFSDIRRFPVGTHPGIILRLHCQDYFSLQAALARLFATVSEADFPGNLIVVDDSKIRIRRPTSNP